MQLWQKLVCRQNEFELKAYQHHGLRFISGQNGDGRLVKVLHLGYYKHKAESCLPNSRRSCIQCRIEDATLSMARNGTPFF